MKIPNKIQIYEGVIIGSCNLEVCVQDWSLAETLLRNSPEVRKLYPVIEQNRDEYIVKPGESLHEEEFKRIFGSTDFRIPKSSVTAVLAAGGGANAAKVISKLGGKVRLVTSIGPESDPNYDEMVESLAKSPGVDFINLQGRPSVGITLNITGGGNKSTLLIYQGAGMWKTEKMISNQGMFTTQDIRKVPVMSIALTRDYLPLMDFALRERGRIDYFCPSRSLINNLKMGTDDENYFRRSDFIQANLSEFADIYEHLSDKESSLDLADPGKLAGWFSQKWGNTIIATDSENGGYLAMNGEDIIRYRAYETIPGPFTDDTGAGDAFAGSFFWAHFINKRSIIDSIALASGVSAFKITGIGATTRLPALQEVERWISSQKLII